MLQWSVRVKVTLRSTLPPSLLPFSVWLHCSFAALAAGGAVRLECPPPTPPPPTLLLCLFLLRNKAVTYSILLCPLPPPSLTATRQCWATAASSSGTWAGLLSLVVVGAQCPKQAALEEGRVFFTFIIHYHDIIQTSRWKLVFAGWNQ